MLITDEISHEGLLILPFYRDWYDAFVSRWYFEGRVHYCNYMLLLTVSGVSQK